MGDMSARFDRLRKKNAWRAIAVVAPRLVWPTGTRATEAG